jgi:hypothetical protein
MFCVDFLNDVMLSVIIAVVVIANVVAPSQDLFFFEDLGFLIDVKRFMQRRGKMTVSRDQREREREREWGREKEREGEREKGREWKKLADKGENGRDCKKERKIEIKMWKYV